MRTVTGTITAWLSAYGHPEDLTGPDAEAFNSLLFSNADMSANSWSKAGKATVTVEIFEHGELVQCKVDTLRAAQTKARADAQLAEVGYERQIQELLAITDEAGPINSTKKE